MPRSLRESGSGPARAAEPAPQSQSQKHPGSPGARPHHPPASRWVVCEGRPARAAAGEAAPNKRPMDQLIVKKRNGLNQKS